MAHPAAYLYRMAANLASDRRLARSRAQARDTAWLDAQPLDAEHPDLEARLLARDRLDRIDRAIAAMPERMRVALRRFRLEQRSQKDIASELGISVSGVEKLLKRAYRQLLAADDPSGAD
jgi:RNA polymerase sigma-70 factor (ECF subfamily)